MSVIKDNAGDRFSRKDLVLAVANQDGGGHVDRGIEEGAYRLTRSNSLSWTIEDSHGSRPMGDNPVMACLRQMAYEVVVAIEAERPDLAET